MKQSEAAEIVMMLIAAYPNAKAGPATSAVYETALADLDVQMAHRAVTRLIATAKWLPTVAEIRAAATELRLGPVRSGGEAWQDAVAAARSVGRYNAAEFADPLVTDALRLWGSWQQFCDSPEDDPGGRARFIELYDSLALRKRQAEASGIPLPAPKSTPSLPAQGRPALSEPRTVPMPEMPAVPRERPPPPPHRRYTAEELQAAIGGTVTLGTIAEAYHDALGGTP